MNRPVLMLATRRKKRERLSDGKPIVAQFPLFLSLHSLAPASASASHSPLISRRKS
ncbi:hypothetical protein [Ramlibacter sp. 2FC]|uniref:hypothetical protein n=1 Tax=Ramlibacter sp. 2FC TaxID=2502188 RepID=UPI00148560A6|nr:hypothetical protein [Ramlibacter sp. 2FC]